MSKQNINHFDTKKLSPAANPQISDEELLQKIYCICNRGNNAEIKRRKDGSLAVMEVKKNIV